jgi:DNA-binding transcriptional ArsR family regulator
MGESPARMKPLIHPAIEDVPLEAILHALADPVRVALFAEVVAQDNPRNCTTLVSLLHKPIPKSTLSQHMRILREAGLIRGERHGVEMRNTSRCAEIDARYPGLILSIVSAHTAQIEAAKKKVRRRVQRAKRS